MTLMDRNLTLPGWMDRDLTGAMPDVVPTTSGICYNGRRYFFAGLIGELLMSRKIPIAIHVALDMDEMAAVARLEFEEGGDGANPDGRWRSLYTYMEIEAFALMWNMDAPDVHGIPTESITLSLRANEDRYPIVSSDGVSALLYFENGRFRARPDLEYAEKELAA